MEYSNKMSYLSNQWYNDGLKKANIRDLSGAITSLKKSLLYNKANISARNLLGLVYYGIGEIPNALVEWIISNNMQQHGNIAIYYIKKLQENKGELDAINQAIKKYNQALAYAHQGGEDLAIIQLKKVIIAHPTFLRAHQLLAMLYLYTEQFAKARQALRRAHKLDKANPLTLTYTKEVNQVGRQGDDPIRMETDQSVSYKLGNETIIQPVSSTLKENASMITILNIVIGILVGATVVWFLVVPAVKTRQAAKTNRQIIEYSDQIAAKQNEIDILREEVKEYESQSKTTAAQQKKAKKTKGNYESLIEAIVHYHSDNYSWDLLEGELLKVDSAILGKIGKEQYEKITKEVFPAQCEKLYASAQKRYEVANYNWAIEELDRVIAMDETYADGEALLLLGDVHKAKGDATKAKEKYQRVIKLFKDKPIATEATEAMSAQTNDEAE